MPAKSRLSTALSDGMITIADGPICLMRPPAGYDVSGLPRDHVTVQHTFKPDAAAWEMAGYPVTQTVTPSKTAIVIVPRAKALAKAMIAAACASAEYVIIDGAKTDGIDSLFKACRKALGDVPSITKDHGRLFAFKATQAFADWAAPAPARGAHGYVTTAGVFSDGAVDKGSALLIEALPDKLPRRMADFGAGWGYLAVHVLEKTGVQSLDLIEAEALSLACARQNVTDPRAQLHWDDATHLQLREKFDGIVMNPPFHVGRSADPGLGRAFVRAAAGMLTSKGQLWMVANRHLPYEATLTEVFRSVDMIAQNNAYKVFHAARPAS